MLCLTSSIQTSNIKLDMFEVIGNIKNEGKVYNRANHGTNIVKANCEKYLEVSQSTKFPLLII